MSPVHGMGRGRQRLVVRSPDVGVHHAVLDPVPRRSGHRVPAQWHGVRRRRPRRQVRRRGRRVHQIAHADRHRDARAVPVTVAGGDGHLVCGLRLVVQRRARPQLSRGGVEIESGRVRPAQRVRHHVALVGVRGRHRRVDGLPCHRVLIHRARRRLAFRELRRNVRVLAAQLLPTWPCRCRRRPP